MDDFLYAGGIEPESIVDGPGFRYAVLLQGCPFSCRGCHNQQLQTFEGGKKTQISEILAEIKGNPLLDGLTLSGGEPFAQSAACAKLARAVKDLGLSVMIFTGYLWEDLIAAGNRDFNALIEAADIIVDGPFIMELRDIDLLFRGSSNQRIIDVADSLKSGVIKLAHL
jgi:anaerobic ribonucleoside-triphosphate reductase activating protein